MASTIKRIYTAFSPPRSEKKDGAIRFGILGAAKIAPMAIITPALSHPEVIIQAIAARDRTRAEEFAKKHGIPDVHDSYQAIIDDPNIDAVLVPLPNSLHFEWAMRAVRAGKHVLLEKPSVNNSTEAALLFDMPELSRPGAPVLLEAFHNRFHPALHKFLSFVDPALVEHVHTDLMVPRWMTGIDDIEFNHSMGGGCMMMLGTYNFAMLRMIFGAEPSECVSCETTIPGDGVHDGCDVDFRASFRFPNGGTGDATATLRGPWWWKPSEARVTMREVEVAPGTGGRAGVAGRRFRRREVTMHGFMQAVAWHRIDVGDTYAVRDGDGRTVETWTETGSHKAYAYRDLGEGFADVPGEDWWMSYRYQLEAFVDRIKGRPTRFWVDGRDSVAQMKMIDMAYEKSGLGLRPTSSFR